MAISKKDHTDHTLKARKSKALFLNVQLFMKKNKRNRLFSVFRRMGAG